MRVTAVSVLGAPPTVKPHADAIIAIPSEAVTVFTLASGIAKGHMS